MTPPGRSILAVHPGALGDVVLLGHLLRALGGRATLVAGGAKARLLAGLGAAERAIDFDALPMHEVFSDRPIHECRLPNLVGPCDLLVSALGAGHPVAEARLSALARAGEAAYLPVRPPEESDGHLLDLWGRRMGLALPSKPAPWLVPRAWRDEAGASLAMEGVDPGRPYFVIHPGAGSPKKCWPLERFLLLARRLKAESLGRAGVRQHDGSRLGAPVLALGPAEEERWGGRHRELGREFPILRSPSLRALAGLLAGAAAYVGNDSGVSHLSAAVGTRTVAVFQRASERHFAPRGARVRVVSSHGLEEVSVERVLNALMGAEGGPW